MSKAAHIKFLVFIVSFLISISLHGKEEIIIFHTNDIHGTIEESDTAIGYAKMSTLINQRRKNSDNVLFLDAGDTIHGGLLANLSEGEIVAEILREIPLDAMVLGNHDFNFGYKHLSKIADISQIPLLSANTVNKSMTPIFTSNVSFILNDIKIGVFGISSPETTYKTDPTNVQGLTFLDVKLIATKQVKELKRKGADIIIALVHLGIDSSTKLEERSTILSTIPDLDIVIDGHSHSLVEGEMINDVFFAQVGDYSRILGVITINIDNQDNKTYSYASLTKEDFENTKPDPKIINIISTYKDKYAAQIHKKLGYTKNDLTGTRDAVRKQEIFLGRLIANSLQKHFDADFGFINGGGIRSDISSGDISFAEVNTTLPFKSYVQLVEISGDTILETLEHAVNALPDSSGGFLQFSDDITFSVDINKPSGSRVSNVRINNRPLKKNTMYQVATLDFLLRGGDDYHMLTKHKFIREAFIVSTVFGEYLAEIEEITEQNFSPAITFVK